MKGIYQSVTGASSSRENGGGMKGFNVCSCALLLGFHSHMRVFRDIYLSVGRHTLE